MSNLEMSGPADYGIDAPGVIRNLGLGALVGLGLFGTAAVGLWSGRLQLGASVAIDLRGTGLAVGLICAVMAGYMFWSSKFGKVKEREGLLDRLPWKGSERVLDVGCGRGLMLIGAAKRLTTGVATGVDIWQAEDLSGNRPEVPLENARREGVADRVRVETANMMTLPFADGSFDVIVSKAAIHNLYAPADRAKALGEVARVLAPGGHLLIDDIRHLAEYEAILRERGVSDIRRHGSQAVAVGLWILTWGSLRPGLLVARKA
jgi:arsenite methyltransferase